MPYITLDENRFQVAYSKWDDIGEKVDCACPTENYTLKADYESFSGTEQWEISISILKESKKTELASYRSDIQYESVDELDRISYMNSFAINHNGQSRDKLDRKERIIQKKIDKGTLQEADTVKFKSPDGLFSNVEVGTILAWMEMFVDTEQVFYDKEETVSEAIDDLETQEEIDSFDVTTELDSLVKPILSADLAKYSYPIKYYNEDV